METGELVLKGAGTFLVVEGFLSIIGSEDKRPISQVGRVARIAIGLGLISFMYS